MSSDKIKYSCYLDQYQRLIWGDLKILSAVECDRVVAKAYSGGGLRVFANRSIKTRTDSGGIVRVFGSPEERNVKAAKGYYGGRTSFEAG